MKKLFTLFAICVMAVTSAWADVATNYLCFTAEEANSTVTFSWASGSDVQTSTDGITFSDYTAGTTITLANVGDKVYFKGNNVTTDGSNHFTMSGKIAASGDVTSLTNGVGGDATLSESCYRSMFYNCSSLTTAPALPATTLASYCYTGMFGKCTSLTTAPTLPATTLVSWCYSQMFYGCTNLNKVKVNFTDWKSSDSATLFWFTQASSKGTFYCPAGLDATTRDVSHVPEGWTVINFTPVTLSEDDTTYPKAAIWDESKTYDITLNRTMKANQWNTLMLSFPMTAAEVKSNFGSDVTLMKMTGIADNVVNFATVDLSTDDATAIDVCEAYIVKPTSAISQIKVTGKTGLKHDINDYGKLWFSVSEQYHVGERYFDPWMVDAKFVCCTEAAKYYPTYVLSNDKFYSVDNDVQVKGYRWVLYDKSNVTPSARALTLSLDGQTTGIEEIQNAKCKIQNSGKFIEDGRMVIVNNNKKFNVNGQEVK